LPLVGGKKKGRKNVAVKNLGTGKKLNVTETQGGNPVTKKKKKRFAL